jgi:hypothetical protein
VTCSVSGGPELVFATVRQFVHARSIDCYCRRSNPEKGGGTIGQSGRTGVAGDFLYSTFFHVVLSLPAASMHVYQPIRCSPLKMSETGYSLALLEVGNLTPALLVADRCVKAAGFV